MFFYTFFRKYFFKLVFFAFIATNWERKKKVKSFSIFFQYRNSVCFFVSGTFHICPENNRIDDKKPKQNNAGRNEPNKKLFWKKKFWLFYLFCHHQCRCFFFVGGWKKSIPKILCNLIELNFVNIQETKKKNQNKKSKKQKFIWNLHKSSSFVDSYFSSTN